MIRTDADEVTYNLHVMIRFDLELQLLEGKLAVRDLPEAWRARYRATSALPHRTTAMVCCRTSIGTAAIGGVFQGYTLGNILSAQFYEAATKAHPEIPDQISQGEFATLHDWLKENIYQHGSKFTPNEIVKRATGKPLTIQPYIRYLRQKYGDLYSL